MAGPLPSEDKQTASEGLGRRDRRKAETERRIMDAALRLFERKSFLETTIEQITEAADIGKGTFFNYFSSKEEIVTAFADMMMEHANDAAQASEARGDSIREILRHVFDALIEVPGCSIDLCRNMLMGKLACSIGHHHRNGAHRILGERIVTDLIVEGQRRGEVRPDREAMSITNVFFAQFIGVLTLRVLDPEDTPEDLRVTAFDIFWNGIAARKTEM